jgi:hypothetical protein
MAMNTSKDNIRSSLGDIHSKTAYGFIIDNSGESMVAILLGTSKNSGPMHKPRWMQDNFFGLTREGVSYKCWNKDILEEVEFSPGCGVFVVQRQCNYQPVTGVFGNARHTVCLQRDSRVKIKGQASEKLTGDLMRLYLTTTLEHVIRALPCLSILDGVLEDYARITKDERCGREKNRVEEKTRSHRFAHQVILHLSS